jgi:hypothetical protein
MRLLRASTRSSDPEFGGKELQQNPDIALKKLESSLRELLILPLADGGNGEELKRINNLIFLGESATNRLLHGVLRRFWAGNMIKSFHLFIHTMRIR